MILLKRIIRWCFSSAAFAVLMALPSFAAETADIDIKVSLSVSKSVTINTTYYDFGALDVNTSSVSASSLFVTNNSTGLIETYTLQASNAISDTGGTDWTLSTSTDTDQFSLAAQFSDSRPSNTNAAWDQDALSTTAASCTADVFGNGAAGESGLSVLPSGDRNLWFRLITPSAVTDATPHTITVTLSVL